MVYATAVQAGNAQYVVACEAIGVNDAIRYRSGLNDGHERLGLRVRMGSV